MKTIEMDVGYWLHRTYNHIGMDKPANHNEILHFIADDVEETAHPVNYSEGDYAIAFRRYLEKDLEI